VGFITLLAACIWVAARLEARHVFYELTIVRASLLSMQPSRSW
jgi:hypothetical protein